jgi:hypothetical protein
LTDRSGIAECNNTDSTRIERRKKREEKLQTTNKEIEKQIATARTS